MKMELQERKEKRKKLTNIEIFFKDNVKYHIIKERNPFLNIVL